MRTKRNIRKQRIRKTQKRKIVGGDQNDEGPCVFFIELLKEIHIFFTTPFQGISDKDKFLTLYKMKNVLNFITGTPIDGEFEECKSEIDLNTITQDKKPIYESFIDIIRHIFKDSYKKFNVHEKKSGWNIFGISKETFGYSDKEIEFAKFFLSRFRCVYLAVLNKSKEGIAQLGIDYLEGGFEPETTLFNNCCSLLTWDIEFDQLELINLDPNKVSKGENFLRDILSFMMSGIDEKGDIIIFGNDKYVDVIDTLKPYVILCFTNTV